MPRAKKSVDKKRIYRLPSSLVGRLRDLINGVSDKPLTDLRYWKVLEVLDTIIKRQDTETEGYVPLDAKILIQTVGSGYSKLLKWLQAVGVIETLKDAQGRDKWSKVNHEAKQYRLTDTFRFEDTVEVEGAKRLKKNQPKKDLTNKKTKRFVQDVTGFPEYALLKNNLFKLTIDVDGFDKQGKEWIKNGVRVKGEPYTKETHAQYLNSCHRLNSNVIKFEMEYGDRLYTNLTSTARATRGHLKVQGYDGTLYQSDLISSQILVSVPVMRNYISSLTDPTEVQEMNTVIGIIKSGKIYQTMADQVAAEGVKVMDDVKVEFLKHVWNKDESKRPSRYRKAFNMLYPAFDKFIKKTKAELGGNKQFAAMLTRMESNLFNNKIAHRVATELPTGTFLAGIFDSLIYKMEDKDAITTIMAEEVFRLTGLVGMVKTTTLEEDAMKKVVFPTLLQSAAEGLATVPADEGHIAMPEARQDIMPANGEDLDSGDIYYGTQPLKAEEASLAGSETLPVTEQQEVGEPVMQVAADANEVEEAEEPSSGGLSDVELNIIMHIKATPEDSWNEYFSQVYLVKTLGAAYATLSYDQLNGKMEDDRIRFDTDEAHRAEWTAVVGEWKAKQVARAS